MVVHWLLSGGNICESNTQQGLPVCFCSDTLTELAQKFLLRSQIPAQERHLLWHFVSRASANLVEKLGWWTERVIMELTGIIRMHVYLAQKHWRLPSALLFLHLPHPILINQPEVRCLVIIWGPGQFHCIEHCSFSQTARWTATHFYSFCLPHCRKIKLPR